MIKENILETIGLERIQLHLDDFEDINTEKREEFHGMLIDFKKAAEDDQEAMDDYDSETRKLEK